MNSWFSQLYTSTTGTEEVQVKGPFGTAGISLTLMGEVQKRIREAARVPSDDVPKNIMQKS